jgi:hypothetical protein
MISGARVIAYSTLTPIAPSSARSSVSNSVDAGYGCLIFALPPVRRRSILAKRTGRMNSISSATT